MVFSSPSFLFLFLPLFFVSYALVPSRWRNLTIAVGSLVFYALGSTLASLVLLVSVVVNHYLALAIEQRIGAEDVVCGPLRRDQARALLLAGILLNVLPLVAYKYVGFFAQVLNDAIGLTGLSGRVGTPAIELPPGISFFTFQGLSYLIDVYRGLVRPARRLVDFGMYHMSFPQLIAGPSSALSKSAIGLKSAPMASTHSTPA